MIATAFREAEQLLFIEPLDFLITSVPQYLEAHPEYPKLEFLHAVIICVSFARMGKRKFTDAYTPAARLVQKVLAVCKKRSIAPDEQERLLHELQRRALAKLLPPHKVMQLPRSA